MAKRTTWKYRAGARGRRITVYEKGRGGPLYARVWDGERGRYIRRSLGHRDRERAEQWADEEARRLKEGRAELQAGATTLGTVLAAYLEHRTPHKSDTEQRHDARRAELFRNVFGVRRDPNTLDESHLWESYLSARRSGAISARGLPVPAADRRPLTRDRVLEQEANWLCWVLGWGARRKRNGRYLVARAPSIKELRETVTGWPEVRNERRPLVTVERYQQLRAVASQVTPDLLDLMDLAYHTGRRLSQLCRLQYSDMLPDAIDDATGDRLPFGAVRWRAETDKQNRERVAPLNRQAAAAIRRILERRPGIGDAPMFPSPRNPSQPLSRHVAHRWLVRAEQLAKLDPLDGSSWHAFRRAWATARKGLPARDVAEAGGWASVATLERCYQRPDATTMYTVVSNPAEVREATNG